ncbi:MAG: hypothetical protein ACJ74W_02700 [Pyrinomonadaceae bacterium]
MARYTFDQYRKIFDGVLAKYEGVPFFADVIKGNRRPDFPANPREVAVFGIRHEGEKVHHRDDIADDTLSLVRIATTGEQQVYEYRGTTEPGYFTTAANPLGVFMLSPGLYFFKIGKHHGVNDCLVQACTVIGERAQPETDFNLTDDKTWQITDGSIHIHAGIRNLNHVGNWSEGCQVIAGEWEGAQWREFYKYTQMATNFPVPYVLVEEADIPQFLA